MEKFQFLNKYLSIIISILSNKKFNLIVRLLLGFIFIYAGLIKIINPSDFVIDIEHYKMLHSSLVNLIALTLPPLEVICGLLLIINRFTKEASFFIAILMLFFVAGFILAKARGLNISCGCFGKSTDLIGIRDFLRDTGFILMAVYIYNYNLPRDKSRGASAPL